MKPKRESHKLSGTRAYNSWLGMKQRCYYKKHIMFEYYGARGIRVCDRWVNSFLNFLEDMGNPPTKHTLDRINNNGNYEPSNCRWATYLDQANNNRRCNIVEYSGKKQTITKWAKELGIKRTTLSGRINVLKWPLDKAMEIPIMQDHRCNLKGRKRIGPKLPR